MQMIFTLTLRTLRENKKRTVLTILTVILSVGMMTAVLCGSWSLLCFLQEKETAYAGDYAYSMELTSQEQAAKLLECENVEDLSLLHFAGSSFLGNISNKSLLAVAEINDAFIENFSLEQYLLEGRFPSNGNELVLTQEFLTDNDLTFSVGDTIQLSIGKRIWDEIDTELYGRVNYLGERESFHIDTEKTYRLVGIISEIKNSKITCDFNAYSGIENGCCRNVDRIVAYDCLRCYDQQYTFYILTGTHKTTGYFGKCRCNKKAETCKCGNRSIFSWYDRHTIRRTFWAVPDVSYFAADETLFCSDVFLRHD